MSPKMTESIPNMEEDYFTTDQLAAKFHVHPQTIRQWRWLHKAPPGIKLGRRVLFPRSEVQEWLEHQTKS